MSGRVWARAEADAEADAEGRYRNVLVRFGPAWCLDRWSWTDL